MLNEIIEEQRRQHEENGRRLELHEIVEEIDPRQLAGFVEIMKEIMTWLNSQKAGKTLLGREQTWSDWHIAKLFQLLTENKITPSYFRSWMHERNTALGAAGKFPEPFGSAPLVVGALHLAFRLRSGIRGGGEGDLSMYSYHWLERLPKVEGKSIHQAMQLLKAYPCLEPVVFDGSSPLHRQRLLFQRFGIHWGLDPSEISQYPNQKSNRATESTRSRQGMLTRTFQKQPLRNFYALCPMGNSSIDDRGKALWLEDRTWSEQLAEFQRWQRSWPKGVIVRPATLPELIFLDLAGRLVWGDAGMYIHSFRCSHPDDPNKCIEYGRVSQNGAKINIDIKPDGYPDRIMPIFELQLTV